MQISTRPIHITDRNKTKFFFYKFALLTISSVRERSQYRIAKIQKQELKLTMLMNETTDCQEQRACALSFVCW